MAKDISIKYTDKNFNSLKSQLIDLAKNYFPDTYNDFSPTSPGTMFIEMAAYVGDMLSFYQDIQVQETYLQYAKDPANLYSLAYMMGYRPKVTTAAEVEVELTQRVQAGAAPDYLPLISTQALQLNANNEITNGALKFTLKDNVDFSYSSSNDPTEVSIYSLSGDNPSEYLLKKKRIATAGEVVTITRAVGQTQKYLTITVEDSDIIEIQSITDDNGNSYTEVPFLGQETTFTSSSMTSGINKPEFTLSVTKVPYRYVTRFNSAGQLLIQFGAGINDTGPYNGIPDPQTLFGDEALNLLKNAYDPSNFLFTDSYGVAPSNTTLTIKYLRGGGIASNVEANTLTSFSILSSNTPTFTNGSSVQATLTVTNPKAATGGKDGDTVEELRQNSLRSFAEQGRCITKQDYEFRAKTLPSRFGSIAKVYAIKENALDLAITSKKVDNQTISLYTLGYDINKKLIGTNYFTKQNLAKYLSEFMPVTDTLKLKDAQIINIGVKYEIILRPNFNSRDVLIQCTEELKTFFNIDNWQINQPINVSDIYTLLDKIKGVQTVQSVVITDKNSTDHGTGYSIYGYDIPGATKNNIIYPSYDPMIFELKYPNIDIEGRITTL